MKINFMWIIAGWFAAALLLIYDGLFDVITSTNHCPIFDLGEAIIGIILLVLLVVNIRRG
jgi:hypothetical protein